MNKTKPKRRMPRKPGPKTVALIDRIIAEIQKERLRFDMASWTYANDRLAPCQTTACIAGYAVVLTSTPPKESWRDRVIKSTQAVRDEKSGFIAEGQKALGISRKAAQRLFFAGSWPRRFLEAYNRASREQLKSADTRVQRADVAIARLRYFARTGR